MTVIAHQAAPGRAVRQRPKFFIGVAVATLILVVAGFARTFYLRPFFGAIDAPTGSTALPWYLLVPLLVALLGYDIATRRRPHWATLCGALMVALYVPIRNGLVNTDAAAAYIEWLRHLV